MNISEEEKEELAVALLLWKDFKTQGKMDVEITKQALQLAKLLNIEEQFDKMHIKLPPMKIEPRQ